MYPFLYAHMWVLQKVMTYKAAWLQGHKTLNIWSVHATTGIPLSYIYSETPNAWNRTKEIAYAIEREQNDRLQNTHIIVAFIGLGGVKNKSRTIISSPSTCCCFISVWLQQ